MTVNAHLFMWNSYGIESIVPITEYEHYEKQQVWDILKDQTTKPNPLAQIINVMILRARYGSERHYEIYAMDCEEGISVDNLYALWDTDPQFAADLIRERGVCIFSDCAREPVRVR